MADIAGAFRDGYKKLLGLLDALAPAGDLIVRMMIAWGFLTTVWYKIKLWPLTLQLFTYQYHFPILPPVPSAYFWTAIEVGTPILILLGVGGRIPTLFLFVFNLVEVLSVPYVAEPEGVLQIARHVYIGLLLMMLLFHGTGRYSFDRVILRK